jgi:BirA family transcriptional regulator, biotin operon repressor / biotin---[acetyl-CoA-carboxylase] ligase
LAQQAASNSIGSPFIELQTIDSTNKYAMELIHAGMAQHGMAVFSHAQTAGKGQRNKNWITETRANIAISFIIRPGLLQVYEQFYLSAAIAIAVHEFFSGYAGDETKIKWPNDLYWRDRKAGGILIESVIGSPAPVNENTVDNRSPVNSWQWAVIGIGININQTKFSNDLPNPVSLKQITGKTFEPIQLAEELCDFIDRKFHLLHDGKKKEIMQHYNQVLYKLNEQVKLKQENRVFDVIIKGVSSSGKLLTTHAFDEEFDFGSVEWIIEKVK